MKNVNKQFRIHQMQRCIQIELTLSEISFLLHERAIDKHRVPFTKGKSNPKEFYT